MLKQLILLTPLISASSPEEYQELDAAGDPILINPYDYELMEEYGELGSAHPIPAQEYDPGNELWFLADQPAASHPVPGYSAIAENARQTNVYNPYPNPSSSRSSPAAEQIRYQPSDVAIPLQQQEASANQPLSANFDASILNSPHLITMHVSTVPCEDGCLYGVNCLRRIRLAAQQATARANAGSIVPLDQVRRHLVRSIMILHRNYLRSSIKPMLAAIYAWRTTRRDSRGLASRRWPTESIWPCPRAHYQASSPRPQKRLCILSSQQF